MASANPQPRRLVIAGAGGLGRETAALAIAITEVAGFVDDDPALEGESVMGLSVLGPIAAAVAMGDCGLVVAVGYPDDRQARRRIVKRLALPPERYATLVHPMAAIGTEVEIGVGSTVFAGAVFTQGIRVGRHTVIMPNVVLTHDDVVGDFVTFGAGAKLAGGVAIGDCAYVGAGAVLREGTSVGAGAMVGIGSVLLEDVPAGETWAGVPARPLRPLR